MTTPLRQPELPRLLIMLSGGGRTMLNLAASIRSGDLPAEIAAVVVSRECAGADAARDLGIPVEVIPGEIPEGDLAALAGGHRAAWVVLAGYLRRVHIPPSLAGRVINIHPALLPKFGGPGMYGRHVHEAVLRAGETESGCTVHLCDGEYDRGRVVLQERCPVMPGDTPESLAARVFEAECRTFPKALRMVLTEDLSNRRPA
jgi:phosphoribosylglycinamide formyltransferase-1